MKISSNKSKGSKSKKVQSSKDIVESTRSTENKPRYSVEEISNGYIVEKSWSDDKGYHNSKTYSETNPLEED